MTRDYYIKEIISINCEAFSYLMTKLPRYDEMKEARNSDNYLSEKIREASSEEFEIIQRIYRITKIIKDEANDYDLEQLVNFTVIACGSANESLKIIKDILSKKKSSDSALTRVNEEKNNLERERNEWRTKFSNKNREYEDEKEKREKIQKELDKLKDERLRETRENASEKSRLERDNSTLQVELTRKEGELTSANNQVTDLTRRLESSNTDLTGVKNQLEDTKTELSLVRVAKDRQETALLTKIDQKQQQLETVRQSLADLRVESERDKAEKDIEINQKNNELRAKEKELKQKEEQIKKLRNQKGLSHEELLNEKLRSEKGNLKLLATELKISLEKINNLSRYHERLLQARKTRNQANIVTHEDNIAQIEEELRKSEISMIHVQEICRKCEKIAEFRWDLEQLQHSTPPNNNNHDNKKDWTNINPSFTPELVQEWINHGFTYEQCQEWININQPWQKNRAIKEPSYYAWLRDIKKVTAEWVLNQGNERALSLEFFRWYQEQQQQQYQNQQEHSTNNN